MLDAADLERVSAMLRSGASRIALREEVERIRQGLNPHPAQQKQLNVPRLGDAEVPGMQHKYRETVLFFPAEGQVRVARQILRQILTSILTLCQISRKILRHVSRQILASYLTKNLTSTLTSCQIPRHNFTSIVTTNLKGFLTSTHTSPHFSQAVTSDATSNLTSNCVNVQQLGKQDGTDKG